MPNFLGEGDVEGEGSTGAELGMGREPDVRMVIGLALAVSLTSQ